MAWRTAYILIFVLAVMGETKHIHPRKDQGSEAVENRVITLSNNDATETDKLNLASTNFSPHNNILFFKTYDPCEEGFKRDYQGICREVWF